ncbi:MAG TPA: adenylosuccinate lyase [Blastocatellia bacterium]|nr:adenylosuccinate lyase [Blastocatellia bacterium]
MINRYTLPEMGAIWTEENRFRKWLDVELAACQANAEAGLIPAAAVDVIRQKAAFSVERIRELEQTLDHDLIAFTTNLAENIGPEARWVHYGLTSSDVVDTANALQLCEAGDLLISRLQALSDILKRRAHEFKETPMVGRTHGMHAEPTTLGLTFALWFEENRRNLDRMARARAGISYGKLSGAVGTFAHLDPEIEERVCFLLGLRPASISTQIIQRDRYADFVCTLAIIASTLEKIALQIRHWQRTELGEAHEYFKPGQKGSSSMPHKRNPILSERICGMARVVRGYAVTALENNALWHERDISHSSAERVILPDACLAVDYLLAKVAGLIDKLVVNPERMLENLNLTRGLVFSGQLLLELAAAGVAREEAYYWVQRNALKSWDERSDFRELVGRDPDISRVLTVDQIAKTFDLKTQLKNVDRIFKRVFGGKKG